MAERLIIEAGKAEQHYWADLWRYRELFYFLSWRDILVRYKQTVIGVLWAVLRPVLTTAVFVFVFKYLLKIPSVEGVPYPVLVFAAMLPWQFFASALAEASNSLVANANMISKIYFPRLIVPASAIIVALGDFLISLVILAVLMLVYRIAPTWHLLLLFPLTGVAFLAALGAGLWLAALNVEYRDFRYVLPFIVQFGLYLSPVGFSSSIVPERWRLLYSLNPMVGLIDGFRWAITGAESAIYWPGFAVSLLLVALLMLTGLWYFRKTERAFADVI
jgi:lipopolysaccharide transport system permease protein